MMLGRFLCWLGLHRWELRAVRIRPTTGVFSATVMCRSLQCRRCGRSGYTERIIWR